MEEGLGGNLEDLCLIWTRASFWARLVRKRYDQRHVHGSFAEWIFDSDSLSADLQALQTSSPGHTYSRKFFLYKLSSLARPYRIKAAPLPENCNSPKPW